MDNGFIIMTLGGGLILAFTYAACRLERALEGRKQAKQGYPTGMATKRA